MAKDDELSKYMVLIEQYKEQMNQLEMQYQYLQAAVNDYTRSKITLEQLDKEEKGSDILLPIGGSTFVDANVKDTNKVLYDIGAGIVTEKTIDDALKKIDVRIEDLQKTQEKLMTTINQIQNEAAEVSAKAQKLLYEQQKG
jgi:prefoldin alpha subunit